jgi:hypothetical protein
MFDPKIETVTQLVLTAFPGTSCLHAKYYGSITERNLRPQSGQASEDEVE